MKVGFAIAGRHPGHYFLGDQVQNERNNLSTKQQNK